jgi:phosphatidate cytidylyltransferase
VLQQRVITAAVAIPLILVLILVGGWPYAIVAAAGLAVAGAEFAHLRDAWTSPATILTAITVGVTAVLSHVVGGGAVAFAAIIGALLLLLAVLTASAPRAPGERLAPAYALDLGGGLLYAGVLGSTIILLREHDNGRDWVLLALLGTFAVDTCAYFAGRQWGRHKLAPAISPNKTWEGFVGGWVGGFAAVLLLDLVLDIDGDNAAVMLLAFALPPAAAAGDLFESWLKRRAGVKDASNLIPGHGGALDRLDSLLFTFPLVWLVARWLA